MELGRRPRNPCSPTDYVPGSSSPRSSDDKTAADQPRTVYQAVAGRSLRASEAAKRAKQGVDSVNISGFGSDRTSVGLARIA